MKKLNAVLICLLLALSMVPVANCQPPVDTLPPVPVTNPLPTIVSACSVTLTAPTAIDDMAGTVTATSADPLTITSQGSYIITWTYDDGNGNTSSQNQNVIINDTIAPVPDVANLPDVIGTDEIMLAPPTATDNCGGTITATTN